MTPRRARSEGARVDLDRRAVRLGTDGDHCLGFGDASGSCRRSRGSQTCETAEPDDQGES